MTLTLLGVAIGTAGYMSPEQVRGEKLDSRTDLFSFGLVLYELATGQRAFSGDTAAMVREAILHSAPPPLRELNAKLPIRLASAIDKAMEKNRERRYQSAAEMRADLALLRTGERRFDPRGRHWTATALLLVIAAVGGWQFWRSLNRVPLTDKDTIVLGDIANETTDPVFDSLNTAMRIELEQTPFLNLLAADKVRGAVQQMNRPSDTRLSVAVARDVCLHTSSVAFLTGSVADAGNRYHIALQALNCHSGKSVASAEADAENRGQVVKALGVAGAELRRKLGEPQFSLAKFNKPLEKATTSSLDALQAFAQANELPGTRGSLPYVQRAAELDPQFALAYAYMGAIYFNDGDFRSAAEAESRAFALRDRLAEHSRFFVETLYYDIATGELDKANQIYAQWVQVFPRDLLGRSDFSVSLFYGGQFERAAEEGQEAVRLYPYWNSYLNLFRPYLAMNRFAEAKAVVDEALTRKIDDWHFHSGLYTIALILGDQATMDRQWELLHNSPDPEAKEWALEQLGDTAVYHGQLRAANSHYAAAPGYGPNSAGRLAERALIELEVGNPELAKNTAIRALAVSPDTYAKGIIALVFARTGASDEAHKIMAGLNQEYALNTMMQNYVLPSISAAMELTRNEPARAVELLQMARPYQLGNTPSFNWLYPIYIRGLAFLKMRNGSEAAREFRAMVDRSGVLQDSILNPLAHLQLGRAEAMMGDKAAARKSYEDFLELWKDADSDIPVYKQAKAEYAKLQ